MSILGHKSDQTQTQVWITTNWIRGGSDLKVQDPDRKVAILQIQRRLWQPAPGFVTPYTPTDNQVMTLNSIPCTTRKIAGTIFNRHTSRLQCRWKSVATTFVGKPVKLHRQAKIALSCFVQSTKTWRYLYMSGSATIEIQGFWEAYPSLSMNRPMNASLIVGN